MPANVDPSPYAPPAIASAPAPRRRELRLLPGWVWIFPAMGFASAPSFVGLAKATPEVLPLGNLPQASVIASIAFVCLLASINNVRRATFAWSNGERISGWWCASLAMLGGIVFLVLGVGVAPGAWSGIHALSKTDYFAP